MNRFFYSLLLMLSLSAVLSCKKSTKQEEVPYSCATCARTPEARAQHDNIATGIYKGTVVGSSGTVKFDLSNNGNTMTAFLTIDNVSTTLTANINYTPGQPLVGDFTGTWPGTPGGPITVTFSVGATGGTPTVLSSSIPGHPNASFTIYKETSTSLIEAFEGSYDKPAAGGREVGRFNILMARALTAFSGVAKRDGGTTVSTFRGSVTNNNWSVTSSSSSQVGGTVSVDNVTGTIVDQYGTGTLSGRRTL